MRDFGGDPMNVSRVPVKEDDVLVFVFPEADQEDLAEKRREIQGNLKRSGMAGQRFIAMSGNVGIAVLEGARRVIPEDESN